MKTKMKTLPLLITLLLMANFSFSQDVYKKIDSLLKATHNQNLKISFSIGFVKNDTELSTSYGNLNREHSIKVDKTALFEIASITKVITANLIVQAHLENKLNSNDFMDEYLPREYELQKKNQEKIKIYDLASHQSGLVDIDFGKLIKANSQQPISAVNQKSLIALVHNCTELSGYGNYKYSTLGSILLGQILETVYNKSYDEILREKLLNPLKMDAGLTTDFNAENKVKGYNPDREIQELFDWNIAGPEGLVKSNNLDMNTYLKAVLNEKSNIGLSSLLSEKVQYNKDDQAIGLGLNIMTDEGNTIFAKSRDSMRQSYIIGYDRQNNWGLILFLNQRNHTVRQSLFNALYNIVKQ